MTSANTPGYTLKRNESAGSAYARRSTVPPA